MRIYENNEFNFFNLAQCKKNSRITETDHNGLVIDMELKAGKCRSDLSEMFNFKSKVCQDAFFKKTDSNKERLECFEDDNETVAGQASRWRKICKNILHKCKCNCHNSTYNALSKDWITQILRYPGYKT